MASLLGHLHFWTLKEDAMDASGNLNVIGSHRYHKHADKGSSKVANAAQHPYYEELRTFTEERGLVWSPGKKRPEKLRETLKELEDLLATLRCVYCAWHNRKYIKLMLNNGVVVGIRVKSGVGDIEKITIDKYLVGKLHSDHIVDVIFNEASILVSYVEPKLSLVHFTKKMLSSVSPAESAPKKWQKLASLDPKISHVDLVGPVGRRLERKLSCNIRNDQILIWWTSSADEVWPWTPISTDRDRGNVHVYAIGEGSSQVNVTCKTRTKGDPIWVAYGRLHNYRFHSIEQRKSRKGDISVDISVYEVFAQNIQRISVTTILIEDVVVCHAMNDAEDRIALGCKDGSLIIYDALRSTSTSATTVVRTSFVPRTIAWHSSGTVFAVGSDDGVHLECYDMALCRIRLSLVSDGDRKSDRMSINVSASLGMRNCALQRLAWMPQEFTPTDDYGYSDNSHSLMISMERGPLALLVIKVGVHGSTGRGSLSPVELFTEYLNHRQFEEAVNLLMNLNWNVASDTCYMCVSLIVNRLLKVTLTTETEVQLEKALGSFYSPSYLLSDVVLLEYGSKLRCLARRFFQHLLRHEQFEKAFLLAVDIGSHDLFMDIHYVALDKRERILAQVALDRARQLHVGSDSSSAGSSRDEDDLTSTSSECSHTSSASEDEHQVQKTASNVQGGDISSKNSTSEATSHGWAGQAWRPPQRSVSPHRFTATATEESETFEVEEDDEDHGTVHVVHFGVV